MDIGPLVPWAVSSLGLHIRTNRSEAGDPRVRRPLTVCFLPTSVLSLVILWRDTCGHPVSWTLVLPSTCPSLYLPFNLVWLPHEDNKVWLSCACLDLSYLFGSQTQKLRSKDGTINPLTHKNKTGYFHKATKKMHLVWLSYSPEFSPEVRGKGSYISQHGHSIHLYDWKRMFLFALHYTHKSHPLSKSNYCWPPKYIKFGFKSVTFEDLQQPTS